MGEILPLLKASCQCRWPAAAAAEQKSEQPAPGGRKFSLLHLCCPNHALDSTSSTFYLYCFGFGQLHFFRRRFMSKHLATSPSDCGWLYFAFVNISQPWIGSKMTHFMMSNTIIGKWKIMNAVFLHIPTFINYKWMICWRQIELAYTTVITVTPINASRYE